MAIYRLLGRVSPLAVSAAEWARPQSSEPPTCRRVEARPWGRPEFSESRRPAAGGAPNVGCSASISPAFTPCGPVDEALPPLANLRPASIGLPKNGDDGRVGEARRITFAVINVTDNVRGELSAHVITVSALNRQKIERAIECDVHDAESVGIIDTTDVVRRDHSLYLTVAKDISSPQARTKSARSPILKCAARSIRLIRFRPAAPQAPRNRIRANADNWKASCPSLFERRPFP